MIYRVVRAKGGSALLDLRLWSRMLCVMLLLATGTLTAADDDNKQQLLDAMPAKWAAAATIGDVDNLIALYSEDALVHVVFTSEELRGHQEIREYYAKYSVQPPKVVITDVQENWVVASVGILSGDAIVEFPDQPPMPTHFSIVTEWEGDGWVVQLQHISRTDL